MDDLTDDESGAAPGFDGGFGELTRERVLDAVENLRGSASKQELARFLRVSGAERQALRHLLAAMVEDGALHAAGRRSFALPQAPPHTGVIEALRLDRAGDLIAKAVGDGDPYGPELIVKARKGEPALAIGGRALARIEKTANGYEARIIKNFDAARARTFGVFHALGKGGRIEPASRKEREDYLVEGQHAGGATDGDLVMAEPLPRRHGSGPRKAKVIEVIGRADHPRAASILAIAAHDIPIGFSDEEIAEATQARPPVLGNRTDLRHLPLITIDPDDARDHDDAVCALADDDPRNPGGWIIWVAIADVAAYVGPGSALDAGARKRGNSVYFPDRVVPMLPEHLSADLCSLREGEDRFCLAVALTVDATGKKRGHRFVRGLMRSQARLTYSQAQAAFDGAPDEKTAPLMERVIGPLWRAYAALAVAREARQPLELASAEFRVRFGPDGRVASIQRRQQLEAMKLIEEMMIQANVAAAEMLEARRTPLVYRVHDAPSREKLSSLSDALATVELKWAKGETPTPARFNLLLDKVRDTEHGDMVNELVLRSQAQAIYHPENIGHFGLNLAKYAHFTSPIRRYADVIVHRALIRALELGADGLTGEDIARLEETAEHITMCERRAMAAEREATDRYIAAFLQDKIGAQFAARITGVTKAGCFVRLLESGADGLAPMSRLGAERWHYDDKAACVTSELTGRRYALGQVVEVTLDEAQPVRGGLVFSIDTPPLVPAPGAKRPRAALYAPRPGRPPGVRLGKSRGGKAKGSEKRGGRHGRP